MYDAFGVSADACCGYTADYCDSDKLGVARYGVGLAIVAGSRPGRDAAE